MREIGDDTRIELHDVTHEAAKQITYSNNSTSHMPSSPCVHRGLFTMWGSNASFVLPLRIRCFISFKLALAASPECVPFSIPTWSGVALPSSPIMLHYIRFYYVI